ncbi:MAG: HDIG domain-containing protein [Chloroflexi bacterium]|nr:HDIG domain-containing protein [Chloroflexota bacterium]MCL5273127.1 HDIG domain-containing protein [Chloroflexota bacterium]
MSETNHYDRAAALALVKEYTTDPNLIRHMLSVEAAMRAYAVRFGGDPELWGVIGLLHDFDYQRWPLLDGSGHPLMGAPILREHGWNEEIIRAILSHAPELTGVEPESMLEKTLSAVDELTGLVAAVAFVRPSKDIADVKVSSVKKKWKEKAFAAGVHRDEIERATAVLGVPLDEHIGVVLAALQANAAELGLDGKSQAG